LKWPFSILVVAAVFPDQVLHAVISSSAEQTHTR